MPEKILILGGTREAAELAASLVAAGHDVTTALAGRTRRPMPVAGAMRIGGFGGAEGLADYLVDNGFDRLIDATHPFARAISGNAIAAATMAGVELEYRRRQPWQRHHDDRWIQCDTLAEARDALPPGARVFLALGSRHIAPFADRADIFFLVRVVDPPDAPLPLPHHEIVLGLPPRSVDEEYRLLSSHAITHIVCRNSGGEGGYAKIEAARRLSLLVVILNPPPV